jgi:hypothetical protein
VELVEAFEQVHCGSRADTSALEIPRRRASVIPFSASIRSAPLIGAEGAVRMIPYLLVHKAVRGRITRVDPNHREVVVTNKVKRPLVTLVSAEPCLMPVGNELWWDQHPSGKPFVVESIVPRSDGGCQVTLKLMTSSNKAHLPAVGTVACFSTHHTEAGWMEKLPEKEPWTHQSGGAVPPTLSADEDLGGDVS